MAGLVDGVFREKISTYLLELIEKVKLEYGEDSKEYLALYNQYIYSPKEEEVQNEINLKHYEALVKDGVGLPKGIERLYRRQLVVDITMVCAAHCRYCLRANYETNQLSENDIDEIVSYCAADKNLKEILVTGGDPLLVPKILKYLISEISSNAKNIKIIRIGTRLPVQNPLGMSKDLYSFIEAYKEKITVEIAIQINHAIELQPEAVDVINKLNKSGARLYSQNVLLKNINDDIDSLINLYDSLRYLNIEAHYFFHSIPMKGTNHLRTSVQKGLDLIKELTSSGKISGRCKPMYALMTYIGKVVLYDGSIVKKDENNYYHIKTNYKVKDRQEWNITYTLPEEQAYIGDDGYIVAKYLDGMDD
jgi:lysine 2,3-aminomutase